LPVGGLTNIGILGCGGRMGRMLLQELSGRARLAGGVDKPGSGLIGRDLGTLIGTEPCGLRVGEDAGALFAAADVVIDFTAANAAARHAGLAVLHRTALVMGTTGLDTEAEAALHQAATKVAVVRAANMSIGVTLLTMLVEKLAAQLVPDRYDIEIVEMHHRHKRDAPSGTALALAEAAARGRSVALEQVRRRSGDGDTGPRAPGEIGIVSLRGGDVVGDHTVIFAADGERFELSHKASSRQIFAGGAITAALWAATRPPGLYSMTDVLG
jgi:4-hydroxy-tetrahydrodipicolinate reductase